MPVRIDPITQKKLVLVKQLYQHAVVQSSSAQHSVVSAVLSVIGFDLAIETSLKVVVGALDLSKSPADNFQGLVQQCNALLAKGGLISIPDKVNIQYVHTLRNDAQHKAKYPSAENVSDCRTYTRDFLKKIGAKVWGLDFEHISLVDLIQHVKIKEFLAEAEKVLAQGDYEQAVLYAAGGFTYAMDLARAALVGRKTNFAAGIALIDSFGNPLPKHDAEVAYDAFERMQETLLHVALGVNHADYLLYRQIVGTVYFRGDGKPVSDGFRKENIDVQDAEFVIAYCINAVFQIENRVGDLGSPFGGLRLMRM